MSKRIVVTRGAGFVGTHLVLALDSEDAVGHAVNVGTGHPVTVREVAEFLAAGLDSDIAPELPATYRMGDIRLCVADPTRAEELMGFKAKVRLEDGMGELLDWVRTQTATDPSRGRPSRARRSPARALAAE